MTTTTTRDTILALISRIESAASADQVWAAWNDAFYAARRACDGGALAADVELRALRDRAVEVAYARLQNDDRDAEVQS